MKKIILLFCFAICASLSYGQVKVQSAGKTIVGTNTGVSPLGQLHVVRTANATEQAIYADGPASSTAFNSTFSSLYLSNSNGTNNNYSRLNFGDGDNAASASIASRIENHSSNGGSLEFWTRPNAGGGIVRRLKIGNDGNLMVGAGTATAKLSVNGVANKPGGGTWAVFSDKTMKSNVKDYTDGLEEVLQINPVTFNYNGKAGITDTESEYVGIIAQEMQKIAPYTVAQVEVESSNLNLVSSDSDQSFEEDLSSTTTTSALTFDPNALTYMLINSVKEQQVMIEAQAERIAQLEESISTIGSTESTNNTNVTLSAYDLAELNQNTPNPFNGQTNIEYVIPTDAQKAQINVYGQNGQLIKTLGIDHVGQGTLTVTAQDLPSGTYSYQLVVDGRNIKSQKMVVAN